MKRCRKRLALWWRHIVFVARWHRAMHGRWLVPDEAEVPWEAGDQEALLLFFRSATGQKLVALMRQGEARCNAHAVLRQQTENREYTCGHAAGFRSAFAYLVTLSAPSAATADPETTETGADPLLETLAP